MERDFSECSETEEKPRAMRSDEEKEDFFGVHKSGCYNIGMIATFKQKCFWKKISMISHVCI